MTKSSSTNSKGRHRALRRSQWGIFTCITKGWSNISRKERRSRVNSKNQEWEVIQAQEGHHQVRWTLVKVQGTLGRQLAIQLAEVAISCNRLALRSRRLLKEALNHLEWEVVAAEWVEDWDRKTRQSFKLPSHQPREILSSSRMDSDQQWMSLVNWTTSRMKERA